MNHYFLELPYPPSVNHYYRHVKSMTLISKKGRDYRKAVSAAVAAYKLAPMEGELQITVDAFPPDRRRRDLDNLFKSLLDSLQHAGCYKDDSQIKAINARMHDPERPAGKVIVTVEKRQCS